MTLGFWAGGRYEYLRTLRLEHFQRRAKLKQIFSRRRNERHRERVRKILLELDRRFLESLRRADELVF